MKTHKPLDELITESQPYIGKKALWTAKNGLTFEVMITNIEFFAGTPHYTITPCAGTETTARVRDGITLLA